MHCITSYIYKGNDESSCGYRTLINILSKFSAMKQYHNVINGTCFLNFLRILTNIFGADVSHCGLQLNQDKSKWRALGPM